MTSFREKPTLEELESAPYPARLGANAGIYVLEPEVLRTIPKSGTPDFGHDVFPALLREGAPLAAVAARGYVQDIGTFTGYRHAHSDLILGWMPRVWRPEEEGLWQWEPGIFVHETACVAASARLQAPCLIGAGARVDPHACLGPNACVGPGVVVGEGADLIDAIVWSGARVGARACVRHAILADGCSAGADSHLLNVVLEEGAVVGDGERRTDTAASPVEAGP